MIGDHQFPFHDPSAIRTARAVIKDFDPDHIFNVGDYLDLPDLSTKFTRSPEFTNQLSMTRKLARECIIKDMEAAPRAQYHWIEGNHEERLARYVTEKAPALYELLPNELSIAGLMGLKELGVNYVGPYGNHLLFQQGRGAKLMFTHGKATAEHAAKTELLANLENGFSGHVHRQTSYVKEGARRSLGWHTVGTLANTNGKFTPPDRYKGSPHQRNWQQGIWLVDYSTTSKLYESYSVRIIDGHKALWGGKEFRGARGGRKTKRSISTS